MRLTPQESLARERVCMALDTENVEQALEWAERLSHYVGSFKIGKSLHYRAGRESRDIVGEIENVGGESFVDLKGHDTPDQIEQFAYAIASTGGVHMTNIHIANENMCRAAVKGLSEGAKASGRKRPLLIGVTELTSLDDRDLEILGNAFSYDDSILNKANLAVEYGLDGIVCPAKKAGGLEEIFGRNLLYVTPGIKMGDIANKGQKQLYEPSDAIRDCTNSILIIGSTFSKAPNMEHQAHRALREMAPYMKVK